MNFKIFLFVILMLQFAACNKALLYLAGVRNPREETNESLKQFVLQQGMDTLDLYVANDTSAFVKLNKISSSQSGYVFFNAQKKMLAYKDTGQACSAPVILFAKNICSGNAPLYYKNYEVELISSLVHPISEISGETETYDGYACIFWYKYLGKTKFRNDVLEIVREIRSRNCKIKIFMIDLDLRLGWKKQMPIKIY